MTGEKNTKICGPAKIKCYKEAQKKLYGEDIEVGLTDKAAKSFRKQCNCLPACSLIIYDADIDRAKVDYSPMLQDYNISLDDYPGY